jgi:hypothetical protein
MTRVSIRRRTHFGSYPPTAEVVELFVVEESAFSKPSHQNLEAPKSITWRAIVDVVDHDYGICIVWGSLVPRYMRD